MQLSRFGGFVLLLAAAAHLHGQTATPRVPRMTDGKPNLTGLWQTMTTANWDIEDHSAQAGPVFQLGATGAEPPGEGIVEGGAIPFKPEALAKRKQNYVNRLKLDPEVKYYMPGLPRATYMPYPFQIVQSQKDILFAYQICHHQPGRHARQAARSRRRHVDGNIQRALGGRCAGGGRDRIQRNVVV